MAQAPEKLQPRASPWMILIILLVLQVGTLAYAAAYAVDYTPSLEDSVSISDTVSLTLVPAVRIDLDDTLSLSDSLSTDLIEAVRLALDETVVVGDSLSTGLIEAIRLALDETIGISDEVATTLRAAINVALSEAVSISDSVSTSLQAAIRIALSETIGIIDTVQTTLISVTQAITNLIFQVASPVDILVTDPLNRRVGFDGATTLNEIPDATYSGQGSEPQTIEIPNPLTGQYTLNVYGRGTGSYTITIESIAEDGSVIDSQTFTGEATPDSIDSYQPVLETSGQVTITVEPVGVPEFTLTAPLMASILTVSLILLMSRRKRRKAVTAS